MDTSRKRIRITKRIGGDYQIPRGAVGELLNVLPQKSLADKIIYDAQIGGQRLYLHEGEFEVVEEGVA